MKRLKLVLSLYACEPNRGSEPGVGWNWALGMAKRHDTYVLTRANNQEVIEKELARLDIPESETPKFIYVDLSPFMLKLKKRGMPISLYYLLWQFEARRTLDSLNLNADIIHHITFNSFVIPGVWWRRKEKVVLGPLGGMSICPPQFLRLFRWRQKVKEVLRTWLLRLWRYNVFYRMAVRHAEAIVYIDQTTLQAIGQKVKRTFLALETSVPAELENELYNSFPSKDNQIVFAGVFEPRKGLEIALRAYAEAFHEVENKPVFKVFGSGVDLSRYQKTVSELSLDSHVVFCGKVSQVDLWNEIRRSKVLVFPSVRDTSGNIVIEALSVQTPVICFNHQGVATITDDSCAFRIEPSSWKRTITDFSLAMKCLCQDDEVVRRMGIAGRKRMLKKFTWEDNFIQMNSVYDSILSRSELEMK